MTQRIILIVLILLLAQPSFAAKSGSLHAIYEKVKDSVVEILVEERIPVAGIGQVSTKGQGSGVLLSDDGIIFTAAHVVQSADTVAVKFSSGELINAKVLASEPVADVAIVKIDKLPPGVRPSKLGDSDKVKIGDEIFIIGAPLGLSHSLTVGHISSHRDKGELTGPFMLADFFQTDAAINQGNSGGPMFNMHGEVIGIVSHILSKSGGFEGLGFAVTSNTAHDLLIKQRARWTGISGAIITGELARALNLPQDVGILVQRVAQKSPASKVGIKAGSIEAIIDGKTFLLGGDVILQVENISLAETSSYIKIKKLISELPSKSLVEVIILRDGKLIKLSMYLD